jgi:hypothetical protein
VTPAIDSVVMLMVLLLANGGCAGVCADSAGLGRRLATRLLVSLAGVGTAVIVRADVLILVRLNEPVDCPGEQRRQPPTRSNLDVSATEG